MNPPPDSFPRLAARTQRFTLGVPRAFTVAPDGSRVTFLRTASGTSRDHSLWTLDLRTGKERLVADPGVLLAGELEQLSAEESARRERSREAGAGIVGYATDGAAEMAAFALSGRLWLADLSDEGTVRELPVAGTVADPRPDPTGRRIAYVAEGALRVVATDGSGDRALVEPDGEHVTWGLAEFVAAEEMDRSRGYWWAPDGESLLVERADDGPVQTWWISDPADPAAAPSSVRYPAAGTANAEVSLWVVRLDGTRAQVEWDTAALPYLAAVSWNSAGPPLLLVQSRDQRRAQVLGVDPADGSTQLLREDRDEAWVDIVPGVPSWLPDKRLVTTVDDADTRRLAVDGTPVSPVGLQVRAVLDVGERGVLVAASTEPTQVQLVRFADGSATYLTTQAGVHAATAAGATYVVTRQTLDADGVSVEVRREDADPTPIACYAEPAPFRPEVMLACSPRRQLRTAVLLPRGHQPGSGSLPVLMDPYGGPHAQRVLAASRSFLEPQWLADQGFAVVVADGRGTPGRGPAWERVIAADVATPVLEDQVEALEAAAAEHPDLDLTRVAIRGWSFGGYLAALAVLRRPDVFRAAVAGAPVTDWRLYDTHYSERYLGHPDEHGEVYDRHSLIRDAARLERPLLLVHGLADDNVVAAHTLRLSAALLAAGRQHAVLPLTGVTHMATQEEVAENLLLLQVRFLQQALAPS